MHGMRTIHLNTRQREHEEEGDKENMKNKKTQENVKEEEDKDSMRKKKTKRA